MLKSHVLRTTSHSPFLLNFALVLHLFPVASVALGDRKQTNKQDTGKSGTDGDLCGPSLRGKAVPTATHTSAASPSCEAREVRSWSEPLSSSTEPLGVTLSSWLTTSWFRLSGSESHVTRRPKPEGGSKK